MGSSLFSVEKNRIFGLLRNSDENCPEVSSHSSSFLGFHNGANAKIDALGFALEPFDPIGHFCSAYPKKKLL